MSRFTDKIKDTVTNQMQRALAAGKGQGVATKAVAAGQRMLARTPILDRVVETVDRHTPPLSRKRPGTGKTVPLGSGKGGAIALVQPGADSSMKPAAPGCIIFGREPVPINVGCEVTTIKVVNTGDRPISVGSHYHFAEANPALEFDRKAAWGKRQNIISSGMTRFDPGITQEIELIPFGGRRIAAGFRNECGGPLDG